jgi:hypothetical protein
MHSCFALSARNIFRTIKYTDDGDVSSVLAPCLLYPLTISIDLNLSKPPSLFSFILFFHRAY